MDVKDDWFDLQVVNSIKRKVDQIFSDEKERNNQGITLSLDIQLRVRLEEIRALQYQIASVILEELEGLTEEEILAELLSVGLASVMQTARMCGVLTLGNDLGQTPEVPHAGAEIGSRVLN